MCCLALVELNSIISLLSTPVNKGSIVLQEL